MVDRAVLGVLVEGEGEVQSAPELLRRLALEMRPSEPVPVVIRPWRMNRSQMVKSGALQKPLTQLALRCDGVLIVADADDDLPCQLGPQLLAAARQALPSKPVAVVLAKREYEAWFIAAVASLRGGSTPPASPETIRDAKGWVKANVCDGRYNPQIDQPRLTARMDLALARANSPSFDKLCRDVDSLLAALRA